MSNRICLITAVCLLAGLCAAAPALSVPRHEPANLFRPGETLSWQLEIDSPGGTAAKLTVTVYDAYRKTVAVENRELQLGKGKQKTDFFLPPQKNGYYEAEFLLEFPGGESARARNSFGIAPEFNRTAAEAQQNGYRFGVKMYRLGKAWNTAEAVKACRLLGLQWTRELLQERNAPSAAELPESGMNVVYKVERFPEECFDEEKYGPLGEWVERNGKTWMLRTLPRKDVYRKWLKEEVKRIPKSQNVFEIWNEAWDKMSAEDFATISQWIAEAILEVRPDAVIGPNLTGIPGRYTYDADYIRAGGMKHMKMVALHPYGNAEKRGAVEAYLKWLEEQTGHRIELYITEFGTHSVPEGPLKQSELEQARRVVRQALNLYAADAKALIPHWMGQREENRRYHEHWFGFFRRNNQLKPVLIAYAAAARMIDGSRYAGELRLGPGHEAMLFEKNGEYTLALYTRGESCEVVLEPGVTSLTSVDFWGAEQIVAVPANGRLKLTVGPDVQYWKGVSPELAARAVREIDPGRWPEDAQNKFVRNVRTVKTVSKAPGFTGNMKEWDGLTELSMTDEKVNGEDASGVAFLGYDAGFLYIGLDMRDNEVMNAQPDSRLYREDSMEIFISTEPREDEPGYGPHDRQFFATPTSRSGTPVLCRVANRQNGTIVQVPGARYHTVTHDRGWRAEIALPWKELSGFKAVPGAVIALELRVNDADRSHPRWKIDPADVTLVDTENPSRWSLLKLQ